MLEIEKKIREEGKKSLITLSNAADELLENLIPPKGMHGANSEVFQEASDFVYSLLDKLDPRLKYHCIEHTLMVTKAAIDIAVNEGLSISECYLMGIYALFHDTGFLVQYNGNEIYGSDKLFNFMSERKEQFDQIAIGIGVYAIQNTDMKQEPTDKYQRILRDADFAVLANPDFAEWNERLRLEILNYPESPMHEIAKDVDKWKESQYKFLSEGHKWFTKSAKIMYEEMKKENLKYFLN